MGTQGGYMERLPGQCIHKLPTSCLLTSTQHCCACEDQRPHSSTYNVYVDGSGLMPWGTRWQAYCWPCKEYWDNRTSRGVIPISRTRVPEEPDQTRFLARWWDIYDGYADEHYEPWRDVDPGRLPRTMAEVSLGHGRSDYEVYIDDLQLDEITQRYEILNSAPRVDVDTAIDDILADLSDSESERSPIESAPHHPIPLSTLAEPAEEEYTAIEAAEIQLPNHRLSPEATHEPPTISRFETYFRSVIQTELPYVVRTTNEFIPSRHREGLEEVYQERFRFSEAPVTAEDVTELIEEFILRYRPNHVPTEDEHSYYRMYLRMVLPSRTRRGFSTITTTRTIGLDDLPRPEPLEEEALHVRLACGICLQQVANIACVPCGHVCMCSYCADIHMPLIPASNDTPRERKPCPKCRVDVKKRIRLYY